MKKNNEGIKNLLGKELYERKQISFDFFMRESGLNVDNFQQELFPVIGIFALDSKFNLTELYSSFGRLFIEGEFNNKKCEVMLRYGDISDELVIARVKFIHRRIGKMTELYQILKLIQQKYQTEQIMIENVRSNEMKKWCLKNGFVEDELRRNCYIDELVRN